MGIKEMCGKYTLIGGLAILAIGGAIYAIKKGSSAGKSVNKVMNIENLQKPEWTDICHICEYWKGTKYISMLAGVKAENLEEFAKRYSSEIAKDPDKIVYIVIGTKA